MPHRSRRLRAREQPAPPASTPAHLLRAALALALATLAVALISGQTHAAASAASPPALELAARPSLQLPQFIGVLEYLGERSRIDAQAGASYAYRAMGLALNVDVYDYDPARLTAAADAALVGQRYALAKRVARSSRSLAGARLLREGTAALGSHGQLAAREALFSVHNPHFSGRSYLWVAAVGTHLLQMRLDVRSGFEDDGHVSRSEVLAALGDALEHAPAVQSALAESAPRLNVAIVWDPATPEAERQLWTVYLFTRAAQAAKESEDRSLPLGVRPASFDEEVRARRMAVNVFRTLALQDPQFRSPYFADLDRVETAGFLREYVWRYLRGPAWDARPGGLNLTGFDTWRGTHLSHHQAVTHGHISLRLATK